MEQFSKEAQRIISLAESLAFHYNHAFIGSEHILLAILKEKDHPLTRELEKQKITYDIIAKKVKALYDKKEKEPLYMEYTVELKILLSKAQVLAKERKQDVVTPILLAQMILLDDTCSAYELLRRMKVDWKALNFILQKEKRYSDLDNLTDLHPLGKNGKDPLIGRKKELTQLINALSRRNKPNAVLIGEPGVGKTAICEELARLLEKNAIPSLKDKRIYELDIASTVGGTKYRGEFEEKIKKILKKVKEDGHAILFIDEIHNIVKAGGAEGAIDASNILKPYLARGEIQMIGATTEEEYEQVFEKDKPLKRRFQVIRVEPSTVMETKEILKNIKGLYENYYHTEISDLVLDGIVDLTNKYLPDLYFPDKAIDVLDNTLVAAKNKITIEDVYQTLSTYYKIEVGKKDPTFQVMEELKKEIYGQERALQKIEQWLHTIKYRSKEEEKPLLSLFFLGPSGVGKTKVAEIMGNTLFGPENILRLNMSSYQDPYALQRLISPSQGAYGEEGSAFVRRLRSHPHSLILLDEIEKAGNEILDFFLGILDRGYFQDGKGRIIDVHNAMFIMTSNYGFDDERLFSQQLRRKDAEENETIQKLQQRFRFEFLSRLDDIIVFSYLGNKARKNIAERYLKSMPEAMHVEFADIESFLDKEEKEYAKYGARLIKQEVKKACIEISETKVQNKV